MVALETLARTALGRDSLLRSRLVQTFLEQQPRLSEAPRPRVDDRWMLGTAAPLLELFAERRGPPAPAWARDVGPVPEPVLLVEAAARMQRPRVLREPESPAARRTRGLYPPPDFLVFGYARASRDCC